MLERVKALELKLQEAENNLRLIGDMAVVDWDDTTVGKVDAVVKGQPPQTYIDKVRNLYKRAQEAEQLEIRLQEAERQRDEARRQLEVYSRDPRRIGATEIAFAMIANTRLGEALSEHDQLIKVVDALMHTTSPHASLNDHVKAREAYSLLPHVITKK